MIYYPDISMIYEVSLYQRAQLKIRYRDPRQDRRVCYFHPLSVELVENKSELREGTEEGMCCISNTFFR